VLLTWPILMHSQGPANIFHGTDVTEASARRAIFPRLKLPPTLEDTTAKTCHSARCVARLPWADCTRGLSGAAQRSRKGPRIRHHSSVVIFPAGLVWHSSKAITEWQSITYVTWRVAQTINSKTILGAAYAGFTCAGLESTSGSTAAWVALENSKTILGTLTGKLW
jgi:hypothetical protein